MEIEDNSTEERGVFSANVGRSPVKTDSGTLAFGCSLNQFPDNVYINYESGNLFGPSYRAAEKRSSAVKENATEPPLILFERLDLGNREECVEFLIFFDQSLKDHRKQLLEEVCENEPQTLLMETQEIVREVLAALADGEEGALEKYKERVNAALLRRPVVIQFIGNYLGFVLDVPPSCGFTSRAVMTVSANLFFGLARTLNSLTPLSPPFFAWCPVCQRLFQLTRRNRSHCSVQCADTERMRENRKRRRDGHAQEVDKTERHRVR